MSTGAIETERIWVTAFIDRLRARTVNRPIIVSCLSLGLVPVVLTGVFFGLTWADLTLRFASAHLLAATVPFVGVAAIWYWDTRVFPGFVDRATELAADPETVTSVAARYKRVFVRDYPWFAVPWTALVVGIIGLNRGFFETIGVSGVGDPAFWVYLGFALWWGLITGIGFHGAITAIRTIRAVGQLDLQIDPLEPDGLGGLSSVGYLAIWTTMLISLGSLTLPLAFLLGAEGGYSALVYVAVAVYILVITVSFVYPTVYVNRRAQEIREQELDRRRSKIRQLQAQAEDLAAADGAAAQDVQGDLSEVATRLEIQRLRDEYTEYADVNLYPLSIGIITRLVSSILLPVGFIVFEMVLAEML